MRAGWLLNGKTALLATALVPAGVVLAQERVAQDPHDSVRAANSVLVDMIPEECVAEVMSEASDLCPNTCMIRVPNSELPKANACDKRTWVCDWPIQPVNETLACPAGWAGTFDQDRYYKLVDCGSALQDTHKTKVLSVHCTRQRPETKVEACPSGAGWVGGGVTYVRYHNEQLGTNLTDVIETGVTPWAVASVDCRRDVGTQEYEICPYLTGGCMIQTLNGKTIADSCNGNQNGMVNLYTYTTHQRLANDLVTVVTDSSDPATAVRQDCPPPPPPVDPTGDGTFDGTSAGGDGGGGGGGDGEPLVIDMEGTGVNLVSLEESSAAFDWVGRGSRSKTAWIGTGTAFLVMDETNSGKVTFPQMFGDRVKPNGFEDLAERADTNRDGMVDARDTVWKHLRVWLDANGNGDADPGELQTMAQAKIASISAKGTKVEEKQGDARIIMKGFVKMENGSYHQMYDVVFPYVNHFRGREVK